MGDHLIMTVKIQNFQAETICHELWQALHLDSLEFRAKLFQSWEIVEQYLSGDQDNAL